MATVIEARCHTCGHEFADANDLNRCSLDAYADKDDYDLFCPYCDSDEIILYEVH